MALHWMDSFDHYGTDIANLSRGVYASVGNSPQISSVQKRTGTYSLRITNGQSVRRAFLYPVLTCGVGVAVFPNTFPTSNDNHRIEIRDAAGEIVIIISWSTVGNLRILRGDISTGVLVYETSAPVINSGSWQHVEFKLVADATNGAIEVRVNQGTVVSLTGIATLNPGVGLPAQVLIIASNGVTQVWYYDDLFVWDTTGSNNNDFIGDKRVYTLFADSDTSVADYTVVGASSGFSAINGPPDFDTSYISIPAAGDTAEFGIQDLPTEVATVSAVEICTLMRKTDSGTASVNNGLVSGLSSVESDSPHLITTEYTYWMDVFETDPATGALWTPAGLNAAKLRIKRAS